MRPLAGAVNGIPERDASAYTGHMTTQIAVRLPDRMVRFLDRCVAEGTAASRAAVVADAVEREMRRRAAEQDADILVRQGPADYLDELVDWSVARVSLDE